MVARDDKGNRDPVAGASFIPRQPRFVNTELTPS